MTELTPTVIIDSREQAPWRIDSYPVTIDTLWCGDYGLKGFSEPGHAKFIIERKSLPDLLGSLSKDRRRFLRECERLSTFWFKALIIEADRRTVEAGSYRSQMTPKSVLASLDSIMIRYSLPTIWAGDARGGSERFQDLVRQFMRTVCKEFEELRKGAA